MTFNPNGYAIAEVGTGHLGSLIRAKEFVHIAKAAGADAVKFQLFCPHTPLFCSIEGDEKRHQRWWDTSLTWGEWQVVRQKCGDLGIDFLASVFQDKGIAWLKDLEPAAYKVASRAAKTYPYDKVPGPFIVSDGFGLPPFKARGTVAEKGLYTLHCVPEYPVRLGNAKWLGENHGLSDHSGTPWPAIDALARGAKIIEVHFGDKEGPDGPVNLTIDQLKMVCDARDAFAEMRG